VLNIQKLKEQHDAFSDRVRRVIDSEADDAGKAGVLYARENTGYRNRTGTLTEATQYKVVRTPGGKITRIKLFNRTPYAAAIDKGARPHVIEARRAPYLVFYWSKMSRWMRVRRVNHPGNKPYKFLSNATLHAFEDLRTNLQKKLAELAKRF